MEQTELIQTLNKDLAIALPDTISFAEMQMKLAANINQLIQKDFQKLVTLLYRIDVNETKLKLLLQQHSDEDAGKIIAALIIERQIQKIKTRQQFSQRDQSFNEEDELL